MGLLTFPGGIHPPYCKDISLREPLRVAPLPKMAVLPMSQHIGTPNEPLVKKGDIVEEGQVIGRSDSYISSPVHSPVYGTVKDVKKAFHPSLGPVMSVFIERDEEKESQQYTEVDVEKYSKKDLIEKVKEAGIVGMGGAAFPTYVKLSVPEGKKITDLVINGAECEPFLTCDHVLMTRKTQEILNGIELLIKIIEPERTYVAIENNKKSSIFAFQKAIQASPKKALSGIKLVSLHTKYPQGGEKQIIKAISNKEVPPGKLPLDIGFVVQNVGTVFAVYEAIYFNKPLIERAVTISGDCLTRPGNYIIRIGATIVDIIEQYGVELSKEPAKVIVGGPMMGFSQPNLEAPVLKSTSGILLLSEKYAKKFKEQPCVRCAKCVDVCPVNLLPTDIMRNVKAEKFESMEGLCISDCMECGACTYICPARIPLVQYIKEGKAETARK